MIRTLTSVVFSKKLKAPNHEKTEVKPMLRDKYSKILDQYSSKVSRSINTRKEQETNMY